ncbi:MULTISPECIES: VOC family protein [Rhodococcus]|jgi:predicted enzyme related to lactoylglutathione lyase|uniref:VOC family protein n=1 Tax=Rhodococcus oxybenzonivorans TaxID=1990687 RepID=A0AAE4V0D7_9NOCA|nr:MULTISPECIES: VOC family protein [Rhodococcus]MDV7241233.1 VOC family protein [Rhodococcus oxybenzonivorans]MDV7265711.1 VOC family protein [Rhodococcus oxybenzonivorans]MDV7273506.1 VOC family protein [Rhodococcus oxybenzonivorans]MDV7332756.1 VOC family protein [Rhodococcus oxybenzonivorans]MDV7341922.1 VOC family protein [Rhodococcus oxybenzonivorans]
MTGRIVHFELPFDDGERARAFYRDAFDWAIAEIPEMDYSMVTTGPVGESGMPTEPGFINGGMMQRDEVKSPVVVVDVESIDAALEKVESLGGKTVTGRTPVGTMGFAAYFTDTEGNVVGLWETAH